MNTNETVAELEARLAALKAEVESKKIEAEAKAKEEKAKEAKAKELAKLQVKLEEEEKHIVMITKHIALPDVTVTHKSELRPGNHNEGPFHSITFSEGDNSISVSIYFDYIRQNTHSHYTSGPAIRRYMEIGSRNNKVQEKKSDGFDYSKAAEIVGNIWTNFMRERKASKIESINRKCILNHIGPKMMEIAGKVEEITYTYEYKYRIGVELEPLTHEDTDKCVRFSFGFSRAMSSEDAIKLYKALFDLGIVGRS